MQTFEQKIEVLTLWIFEYFDFELWNIQYQGNIIILLSYKTEHCKLWYFTWWKWFNKDTKERFNLMNMKKCVSIYHRFIVCYNINIDTVISITLIWNVSAKKKTKQSQLMWYVLRKLSYKLCGAGDARYYIGHYIFNFDQLMINLYKESKRKRPRFKVLCMFFFYFFKLLVMNKTVSIPLWK